MLASCTRSSRPRCVSRSLGQFGLSVARARPAAPIPPYRRAAPARAGRGARIGAVGDHLGGVARAEGLDVEALARWVREQRTVKGFAEAEEIDRNAVLTWDCDVLIPAAIEDVLTVENASEVRASLIAEAANAPTTPEADEILLKRA